MSEPCTSSNKIVGIKDKSFFITSFLLFGLLHFIEHLKGIESRQRLLIYIFYVFMLSSLAKSHA